MDNTGFVVGQPLPAGKLSAEGQRFTLKAQAYEVQDVLDEENLFFLFGSRSTGSRKNGGAATVFDGGDSGDNRAATGKKRSKAATIFDGWDDDGAGADPAKKSTKNLLKQEDDDRSIETNFNRPVTKKAATKAKKKKVKAADSKKKKKGKKDTEKAEASAAGKIKAKPAAAKAKPVKKKKKIEEATAEPVFGQQ
jgi:hypothetical protein